MTQMFDACGEFPFEYWNARYGNVVVLGVIIKMIKSSSFMIDTKISIKPEMNPPLESGNTIFAKRLKKPQPTMVAASSNSPLI